MGQIIALWLICLYFSGGVILILSFIKLRKMLDKDFEENVIFGFEEALVELKGKGKVCRFNWNGQFVQLYSPVATGDEYLHVDGEPPRPISSFLVIKTAEGILVPWVPSQSDLLAEDWMTVKDTVNV